MGLEYSPHSSAPHRPAAGPQLKGIKHKTKNLPSAFMPKTKRNLICLLANPRPRSTWQLGSGHVKACIVCAFMCSCAWWPRPGHALWEHRWLPLWWVATLGPETGKMSRCPRGGRPGESGPRSDGWEIPVARTCGSLRRPRGLTGSVIPAFSASPAPWGP